MGIKICFYPSIINKENEELDILNEHCIYSIKAGEVCSEFISRYFFKPGLAPEKFLDTITKENYTKEEKNAKQEILKNIYKVKIEDMMQDSNLGFELKTFKESKIVRENLLDKYQNLKEEIKEAKVDIYAILALDE